MSGGAISSVAANGGGQSQSLHKVFVYGSLMAEDVCRVLLNRVPQSSPAILNGYDRYNIKGRVYPAILPVENKKVTGKVLVEITDPELHILDEFEDVEYERSSVEVSLMTMFGKGLSFGYKLSIGVLGRIGKQAIFHAFYVTEASHFSSVLTNFGKYLGDSSESLPVQAYVWSNKNDPNLYGDWNFEEWKQLHMKDFVKMTSGFMEELELPEAKPRVATYESFFQRDCENPPVS